MPRGSKPQAQRRLSRNPYIHSDKNWPCMAGRGRRGPGPNRSPHTWHLVQVGQGLSPGSSAALLLCLLLGGHFQGSAAQGHRVHHLLQFASKPLPSSLLIFLQSHQNLQGWGKGWDRVRVRVSYPQHVLEALREAAGPPHMTLVCLTLPVPSCANSSDPEYYYST